MGWALPNRACGSSGAAPVHAGGPTTRAAPRRSPWLMDRLGTILCKNLLLRNENAGRSQRLDGLTDDPQSRPCVLQVVAPTRIGIRHPGLVLGPISSRGGAPQSSQRRFPHLHSNMWMMPPLRASTTVRTSFILLPQIPQVLSELSSTTHILSARNISMKPTPCPKVTLVEITTLLQQGNWRKWSAKLRQICDYTQGIL